LVQDAAGNLYGTTSGGGVESSACEEFSAGCGVVFELIRVDSGYNFKVLYSFTGRADGGQPVAGLIRDSAGNLYGTTARGGAESSACSGPCGVVFKLSPTGTETVLYSFTGPDGFSPTAGLVRDAAGNLYGATIGGGASGLGVLFKLSPAGTETVLHSFTGADGANPYAGLVPDTAGNLYGTTSNGGAHEQGVVFKLNPTGTETVLYSFTGGADGDHPQAGLVRDSAGNLYGTTFFGGTLGDGCTNACGVAFKLSPTGTYTVLYSFPGSPDGGNPFGGLIQDTSGNLYGATRQGGAESGACALGTCGVVFELIRCDSAPSGYDFKVLHSFTGADGDLPLAGLILDAGGNLYGTTNRGGAYLGGVVFRLAP
jgi:uncharacterized repeat protein (TIGR03803 family)